jgi:hypothetical protein
VKWKPWVAIGVMAALTGCATGYHSATNPILGMTGGYWDAKGPGRLIKVGFSGNGFIKEAQVETYLLYRCAEVTRREGGTHFVLYSSLPNAIRDVRSAEREARSLGGKPYTWAYIDIVAAGTIDAHSADEVITRLGPIVHPATKTGAKS